MDKIFTMGSELTCIRFDLTSVVDWHKVDTIFVRVFCYCLCAIDWNKYYSQIFNQNQQTVAIVSGICNIPREATNLADTVIVPANEIRLHLSSLTKRFKWASEALLVAAAAASKSFGADGTGNIWIFPKTQKVQYELFTATAAAAEPATAATKQTKLPTPESSDTDCDSFRPPGSDNSW